MTAGHFAVCVVRAAGQSQDGSSDGARNPVMWGVSLGFSDCCPFRSSRGIGLYLPGIGHDFLIYFIFKPFN